MSWLFSQALVEEYSAGTCSDGEPCAQWNVMPTPQGFWRNDKMMEASSLSRFGPTLQLLTADRGEAVLMSYLLAFPVRTSAQPAAEQELRGRGQGCGARLFASFAKLNREKSTWKTHQCSLLGGLESFSETWPNWGLMRAGECWERVAWAPRISGTECGFQRRWPTPVASASKGSSPASLTRKNGRDRSNDRLDHAVMASDGGQLNPEWVEWLMGWPQGWTELKPLATGRFREWRRQHSTTCRGEGEE